MKTSKIYSYSSDPVIFSKRVWPDGLFYYAENQHPEMVTGHHTCQQTYNLLVTMGFQPANAPSCPPSWYSPSLQSTGHNTQDDGGHNVSKIISSSIQDDSEEPLIVQFKNYCSL